MRRGIWGSAGQGDGIEALIPNQRDDGLFVILNGAQRSEESRRSDQGFFAALRALMRCADAPGEWVSEISGSAGQRFKSM